MKVSLDLKTIDDALKMASIAVEAGADWLEIGTPLALSQGTAAVRELRNAFPHRPADRGPEDHGRRVRRPSASTRRQERTPWS